MNTSTRCELILQSFPKNLKMHMHSCFNSWLQLIIIFSGTLYCCSCHLPCHAAWQLKCYMSEFQLSVTAGQPPRSPLLPAETSRDWGIPSDSMVSVSMQEENMFLSLTTLSGLPSLSLSNFLNASVICSCVKPLETKLSRASSKLTNPLTTAWIKPVYWAFTSCWAKYYYSFPLYFAQHS